MSKEIREWTTLLRSDINQEQADLPVASEQNFQINYISAKSWAINGNNFSGVPKTTDKLPGGIYKIVIDNYGNPHFNKMPINADTLINLPDSAVEQIITEYKRFWKLKPNFDARGMTFKRGFFLYGPPGSGKTAAIWQMSLFLIHEMNGVVIFAENPKALVDGLMVLRTIEGNDRPVLVVYEDFETLINRYGEHEFLAVLDGETQISNVVHIATTNYIEKFGRRFVDRPSRFDTVIEVGWPSENARRIFIKTKEPDIDDETLERWVKKTENYSIAHIREAIIAIKIFEQNEDNVFNRLNEMRNFKYDSEQAFSGTRGKVGF